MDNTWSYFKRVYAKPYKPLKLSMRAALIFALLALILATHARFPLPLFHGFSLAAKLADTQAEQADLTTQNTKLAEVLSYLETPVGQQLAARAGVFALAPGERQIVLLSKKGEEQLGTVPWSSRFQQSLEATGKVVIQGIRYSVEALATWAGVSEEDRQTWHEITEGASGSLVPVPAPAELWPPTDLDAKSPE